MLNFQFSVVDDSGEVVFVNMFGKWRPDDVSGAASDMFMMFHRALQALGIVCDFPVSFGTGFGSGNSRHGLPYTAAEIERMKQLRDYGLSYELIARDVGRSPDAVQRKLLRL